MRDIGKDVYGVVEEIEGPRDAKKMDCHAVYKIKDATNSGREETLSMKFCNVLHGNLDKNRVAVRRD